MPTTSWKLHFFGLEDDPDYSNEAPTRYEELADMIESEYLEDDDGLCHR